jgi:hypothetical protein
MKTDKIRDAIADLQEQKDLIDNAIESLQEILVRLNGHATQVAMPFIPESAPKLAKGSYIDLSVQLLRANGRPMHVKKIVEQIRVLRNDPTIKRGSVESTLLRHIEAKAGESRVRKVGPGTYGLPKAAEVHALEVAVHN